MENVINYTCSPSLCILYPKLGPKLFQYWGERTNSYFTPLKNNMLDIFPLETYIVTLELMLLKIFQQKRLKNYPKLKLKKCPLFSLKIEWGLLIFSSPP